MELYNEEILDLFDATTSKGNFSHNSNTLIDGVFMPKFMI